MSVFSGDDKARIAEAIRQAELRTSGEIVAVVARESDDYRFIALLWAALIALAVPLVLIYLPQLTRWHFAFQGPETLYLIQLVLFAVLAGLLQVPPIRYAVTPSSIKRARAHKNAMEQFVARDMNSTQSRTGVLIFVSIAERYAEIIADEQIYTEVDPGVWQRAVKVLTGEIGASRPADGFVKAIELCGGVLAEHFPPGPVNEDELPNHLIELD